MALSLEQLTARNAKRKIPEGRSDGLTEGRRAIRPWEDPPADLLARVNAKMMEQPQKPDETLHVTKFAAADFSDSRTSHAQLAHESRTNDPKAPDDSRTSRAQLAHESRTNDPKAPDDSRTSRAQLAHESRTNDPKAPDDSRTSRAQLAHESRTNDPKAPDDSRTSRAQLAHESRTNDPKAPDDSRTSRAQLAHESRTNDPKAPDDSRTNSPVDLRTKKLPRSQIQRVLLHYLLEHQISSSTGRTPMLSRTEISTGTGIKKSTIDNTMRRLVASNMLKRVDFSNAWNHGGSSYIVSKFVINQLAIEVSDSRTNKTFDSRTSGERLVDVSSCSIKNTTNHKPSADRDDAEKIQFLIDRFRLDTDFKLGANDLLNAMRHAETEFVDFSVSVEHLAFYLRSSDAQGINHPKAWFLKQLRAGFYAAPVGFISWEEQQVTAKVAAAEDKAKRLKDLHRRQFDADFDVWRLELSPEKKRQLLSGKSFLSASDEGPAVMFCLREAYALETGHPDPAV